MATDQATGGEKAGERGQRSTDGDRPQQTQRSERSGARQNPREELQEAARDRLEQGKRAATEQADAAAEAVSAAAERLRGRNDTLAGYAEELSHGIASAAGSLRTRNIDELSAEALDLARRNPLLFILGSITAGVLVARFMKASGESARSMH